MNKILRFSLLSLFTLICGMTFAQTTVTFVAGTDKGADNGTAVDNASLTKDGITITFSNGVLGRTDNYRCYKSKTMTISSTVGNITKVELTCTASDDAQYGPGCFTNPTVGTYSYSGKIGTWTGDASSFVLSASSNQVRMTQIAVTYTSGATTIAAPSITGATPFVGSTDVTITGATGSTIYYTLDNTDPTASSTLTGASPLTFTLDKSATVKAIAVSGTLTSTVASKDFTMMTYTDATIASLNDLKANLPFVNLTLTNAKVVYIDGSSVYVREGDKAIDFFNTGLSALTLNSTVSGTVKGDFSLYKNIPEVIKNSDTNADGLTITPSTVTTLDPVSTTVSDLLALKHVADLVKLTGVTLTSVSGTKTSYYANSGDNKIQLYGNDTVLPNPIDATKTYTVVAIFNTTYNNVAEVKPITITEETPTGINTITTNEDNANSPIFNLAGQRVSKSYKGIIIQNGKKLLNK